MIVFGAVAITESYLNTLLRFISANNNSFFFQDQMFFLRDPPSMKPFVHATTQPCTFWSSSSVEKNLVVPGELIVHSICGIHLRPDSPRAFDTPEDRPSALFNTID